MLHTPYTRKTNASGKTQEQLTAGPRGAALGARAGARGDCGGCGWGMLGRWTGTSSPSSMSSVSLPAPRSPLPRPGSRLCPLRTPAPRFCDARNSEPAIQSHDLYLCHSSGSVAAFTTGTTSTRTTRRSLAPMKHSKDCEHRMNRAPATITRAAPAACRPPAPDSRRRALVGAR